MSVQMHFCVHHVYYHEPEPKNVQDVNGKKIENILCLIVSNIRSLNIFANFDFLL